MRPSQSYKQHERVRSTDIYTRDILLKKKNDKILTMHKTQRQSIKTSAGHFNALPHRNRALRHGKDSGRVLHHLPVALNLSRFIRRVSAARLLRLSSGDNLFFFFFFFIEHCRNVRDHRAQRMYANLRADSERNWSEREISVFACYLPAKPERASARA